MRIWAKVAGTALAGAGRLSAASAAEITVLANQGALSGIKDLAAGFEQATGNKVIVDLKQGPALAQAIDTDGAADVVTNLVDTFDDMVKRGKVLAGSWAEFARAG